MAQPAVLLLVVALLSLATVRAANQLRYNGMADQVIPRFLQEIAAAERLGSSTRRLLSWAPGQNAGSFQEFLQGLMGRNWTQHVPAAWANPSFTWDKLGTFEYSSNLKEFLDVVQLGNLTAKPQSLPEVQQNVEALAAPFCTQAEFVPSEKMFATCVGPVVTLKYVPKLCIMREETKQVVCDPAKLVMSKTPGGCTHKYNSPATWVGKECKIGGGMGFANKAVYGGAKYAVPLSQINLSLEP